MGRDIDVVQKGRQNLFNGILINICNIHINEYRNRTAHNTMFYRRNLPALET